MIIMNKKELMSDNLKKKFQVEIILNSQMYMHLLFTHCIHECKMCPFYVDLIWDGHKHT